MSNPKSDRARMSTVIAERTFTEELHAAFARCSSDFNPIHMDAIYARRTQAGTRVVHGVHIATWALDAACKAGLCANPSGVKVQFTKFITPGDTVALHFEKRTGDRLRLTVRRGGDIVTSLVVKAGDRANAPAPALGPPRPLPERALDLTWQELSIREGAFVPNPEGHELFPALSSEIGQVSVNAIVGLTALVGMICPGLHSIFSGFEIDLVPSRSEQIDWAVETADDRINFLIMTVLGGGIAGKVQAFLREKPNDGPSLDTVARCISNNEFLGQHALVIGGSRGIGATIAKALCLGGAKVTLTYSIGKDDAHKLVQALCNRGGDAHALELDVTKPVSHALAGLLRVTHLYYCATPKIGRQTDKVFDAAAFRLLTSFYVDGFAACIEALAQTGQQLAVFYPSTVYIEESPAGMLEYVASKAAGELVAAEFNKQPGLTIYAPRLPRILTDQTATVPPVSSADPLETVLPHLRRLGPTAAEAPTPN